DHGLGIIGWPDIVEAMAVPAVSGLDIPKRGNLGMERIAISFRLVLVASSTGCGGLHLPGRRPNAGDLMRGVTVCATRRARVTHGGQLSVTPFVVVMLRPAVAGSASVGYVRSRGFAGWIPLAEYFVRPVAAGTIRRYEQSVLGQRKAVN